MQSVKSDWQQPAIVDHNEIWDCDTLQCSGQDPDRSTNETAKPQRFVQCNKKSCPI